MRLNCVNQKGLSLVLIIILITIFVLTVGGVYYFGTKQNENSTYSTLPSPVASNSNPTVVSQIPTSTPQITSTSSPVDYSLDKNSSKEPGLYINQLYKISFIYPKDWNITQDGPAYFSRIPGETRSFIGIEKGSSSINIRLYINDTSKTREIDFNQVAEGNLPSGPAVIISKEFMDVDGVKSLYVKQNDGQEGIFIFTPSRDIIVQADKKDRVELLNLIRSIKFQ